MPEQPHCDYKVCPLFLQECISACFRIFELYHTSFVMHSSGAMILLSNFSDIDFTDNSLQAFKRVTACMLREKGFIYGSFVLGVACRFHNLLTSSWGSIVTFFGSMVNTIGDTTLFFCIGTVSLYSASSSLLKTFSSCTAQG